MNIFKRIREIVSSIIVNRFTKRKPKESVKIEKTTDKPTTVKTKLKKGVISDYKAKKERREIRFIKTAEAAPNIQQDILQAKHKVLQLTEKVINGKRSVDTIQRALLNTYIQAGYYNIEEIMSKFNNEYYKWDEVKSFIMEKYVNPRDLFYSPDEEGDNESIFNPEAVIERFEEAIETLKSSKTDFDLFNL